MGAKRRSQKPPVPETRTPDRSTELEEQESGTAAALRCERCRRPMDERLCPFCWNYESSQHTVDDVPPGDR